MTPAWAHCATCTQPLYPRTARRSEEGWVHTRCPKRLAGATNTCIRCGLACRYRLCRDCSEVTRALGERERWVA